MLSAPMPSEVARFMGQIFSNISSTILDKMSSPVLEKADTVLDRFDGEVLDPAFLSSGDFLRGEDEPLTFDFLA
jgi:hypothetical protein